LNNPAGRKELRRLYLDHYWIAEEKYNAGTSHQDGVVRTESQPFEP